MSGASVAWISIAPVKALALVHPREVRLERFGIRQNRRFYLVDEAGALVNGKRLGRLVQVVPEYSDDERTLTLRMPEGGVVAGEVAAGDVVTTSFYGRSVEGRLVDGPWAEALSELAGVPLRLVQTAEPGRATDRGRRGGVSLVSTASLEALARRAGTDAVDGRRFRMLFGVDGVGPHEEDAWIGRRVRIGEALVELQGNVGRCAVTTQNPDTGVPDLDTLRVLTGYRLQVPTSEPLPFGVWGSVAEPGLVRVGDAVEPQPGT